MPFGSISGSTLGARCDVREHGPFGTDRTEWYDLHDTRDLPKTSILLPGSNLSDGDSPGTGFESFSAGKRD